MYARYVCCMAENVARGLVSMGVHCLQGVIGGRIPVAPFFRFLFYLLILLSSLTHLLLTEGTSNGGEEKKLTGKLKTAA